ncbi:HlyD family efflux transporter periplasmic adaptor subunit [Albimonas sp. CAU 1670]|uniref:HlyD family secretion protein n=1 Tax=Albimonas sp. CAU 1670 TaxID=3032599 RepID=UPI0023DB9173|nr:HlyD family efflux transporter periplasmic adaptor subunit [Albimonas sp. CAU 1670]MDF2234796.1 HlyD family efflux transporter periplasmic adaptor subunit [Albimonas sp. CAU 1670]
MRLVRIVAGFAIALAALWIILGEQLAGASADAVVNARLTTVRAPIAGDLSLAPRELGTLVEQGEPLGSLADPRADTVRLDDLTLERAVARSEIERLEAEIAALEEAVASLESRAADYGLRRQRQLEAQLEQRNSQARALEATLEEARGALNRSTELQSRGVETAANFDRFRAAARVAERQLEAAQADIEVARIELASARRGVFLGEGYNDAPYSEQRISELSVQKRLLAAQLAGETTRAQAIDARIDAERRRVNDLRTAGLTANVRGRVWSLLAADGERVQRGQDVMRLVDCASTLVTLSVAESVYNTLAVGDAAEFRPAGTDKVISGTVLRLAGSGASTIYQNLAVAPSQRHLERYDVAVQAPGLVDDPELGCAVGRTGRVFFATRPLDGLRRLID